ncbi:hypothetical protein [Persicobacter psychrovividus]|uniref:Uncharacterized protein n=1 Tax=Persicobacter psychrovividus TaxID=387638 RepID=A0ABM7VKA5_9BACT|nr:hypothetical protein PEPS_35740 [Persicobacter psychrovividus]BDD01304.1 hypothetical protein PEPS_35840 [Persicobacter psychrovividus]BDD01311.1 hypothetical protein PEPS_35910 [Persicobacter psychrovividus]
MQKNKAHGNYSCSDWEIYKTTHKSGIEGVLESFNQQMEALVADTNAKGNAEQKIEVVVMGLKIKDAWGESLVQIAKNNPLGVSVFNWNKRTGMVSYNPLNLTQFEKLVLHYLYLKNRSYASDYWK